MSEVQLDVRGLEEVQAEMERVARDLAGGPMVDAMRDATLLVQRDAKINAPVDTGRLRASITPEVRPFGDTIQGVVGSNVEYAPYQELGTKYMEGRFYLRRALEQNAERIYRLLNSTVGRIIGGRR